MRFVLGAAAILAASLWLRSGLPIMAVANAMHDDALFVRLAASLAAGDWLGPYDNLTHAKGAAYPAFIALASVTGIPLKMAEHGAYLGACAGFAWVAARVLRSPVAGLACLAVLAFNPVAWSPDSGGRVIREGLYATLTLAILALAAHAFLGGACTVRARRVSLVALGVVGAVFWLTREEGAWLAPSVAVMAVAWAVTCRPSREDGRRAWLARLGFVSVPVAAFAAVVLAVNAANYAAYGVFRNNDFRSRDFQQAYGALSRITHESPRPYVLFPADARRKAYAASPAARELAQVFEGPAGEAYRDVGCRQTRTEPCPEILAGWFMWALRDGAAAAGHHGSATKARSYYRRLAREVNAACERGELRCGPRSDSLVPPWRSEHGPRIAAETLAVVKALATLDDMHVAMRPSLGSPAERALFARMTGERQSGDADAGRIEPGRMRVAESIARAWVAAMPWLLGGALAGSLAIAFVAVRRRRRHPGLVLLGASWVAVAMRVGLLGYLAGTSIPPNHLLYLTPAVPLALLLAPLVAFLALDLLRRD